MKKLNREPIKTNFIPIYEDSIEFERRIREIKDLVAEIIILGFKESNEVSDENNQNSIRSFMW